MQTVPASVAICRALQLLACVGLLGIGTPGVTDGGSPSVVVSLSSDGSQLLVNFDRNGRFHIDLGALAPHLTTQDGSKSFILEPAAGQPLDSRSVVSSDTATSEHLGLRLRTAGIPPGLYDLGLNFDRATLDRLGEAISVEYRWGPLPLISVPASPDDELARVRRTYVDKIVYPMSFADGMDLVCNVALARSIYTVEDPSPRVVSVERTRDFVGALVPDGEYLGDPRGVLALPPLRFTFAIPPETKLKQIEWDGDPSPAERTAAPGCVRLTVDFSTEWHADRTLRFTPISTRVGTTPADRKALADERPLIGMTYEQVAAIWGYPPDLIDVPTLDRLSVWAWPGVKDNRWVHFTQNRADSFDRR